MMLNFALVDKDWESSLEQAMQAAHQSELMIVCPFIKAGAIKRLLMNRNPRRLLVLTRFKLRDFFDGVSDLEALRFLLHRGAEIRGLRHLHAKMYLCGAQRTIVTSANLTDSALRSNHEFGFVSDDKSIFDRCRDYFISMWQRATSTLQATQLDDWDKELAIARRSGPAPGMMPKLGDYGTDLGLGTPESTDSPMFPSLVAQPFAEGASAWHVKFFGTGSQRVLQTEMVLDVLRTDGAHWAGAYPKGKRPRSVQDGDVMFMAKMTRDPNDYLIYGRAIAQAHREDQDDATAADIERRPWKKTWPHYIRVHHRIFVAGTLQNGVSLNRLMQELGADAFLRTQENAQAKKGNTNPRGALRQQAAVRLSRKGFEWLEREFSRALATHGCVPNDDMAKLDWPVLT